MIAIGAFLLGIVLGLRATVVLVALVLVAGLFGALAIAILGAGGGPSLATTICAWGALQVGYLVGLVVRRLTAVRAARRGGENRQRRVRTWIRWTGAASS
jgi:hypothetical protein